MRNSLESDGILLGGSYLGRMSDEEFFDFCQQHPDLRIERTAHHEILLMSPIGSRSGKRNARLNGQLYNWFVQHPELGEIFDSNTGFTLPDTSILSPDASWVSAAKWNALTPAQQDKFAPVCPEFVVELKSNTDSLKALQAKMHDWLRNGAQLAWLLDPDTETAYIYRPGQPEPDTVQGFDHELSGEAGRPGFRLRPSEQRRGCANNFSPQRAQRVAQKPLSSAPFALLPRPLRAKHVRALSPPFRGMSPSFEAMTP